MKHCAQVLIRLASMSMTGSMLFNRLLVHDPEVKVKAEEEL